MSLVIFSMVACGSLHHITPSPSETIHVRDSVVVNVIDSTVIIPVERVVDIVPVYDTLSLETSLAESKAWIDTTLHVIKGEIKNKDKAEFKYIYKDRIEYRDSITVKEVPVEVEKIVTKTKHPFYESILWLFSLLFIIPLIIKIVKYKYVKG